MIARMYNKHNKLLKSDSQRVAFLPCVGFLCLRWSAEAWALRCSHLSKALGLRVNKGS